MSDTINFDEHKPRGKMSEEKPRIFWVPRAYTYDKPSKSSSAKDLLDWIEVQEVIKPKKKKLYAYLMHDASNNTRKRDWVYRMCYVEELYNPDPPEIRFPSHDIEVEE